jgi:acetylornithine deacetylase/succinyl-diaminopimelate desuccinylase-like protein
VQQFVELYKSHTGRPIEYIKAHGSSDARYFDDIGIPVIMFRPDGGNAHGDGEWLSYESWQKFHTILEHYVLETGKM